MLLLSSRGGATQKLCVLIRHSIISSVFLISVGNRCTVTIEKDNESGQMSRSVTLEHTYCSFSVISGHVFVLYGSAVLLVCEAQYLENCGRFASAQWL